MNITYISYVLTLTKTANSLINFIGVVFQQSYILYLSLRKLSYLLNFHLWYVTKIKPCWNTIGFYLSYNTEMIIVSGL